MSQLAKKRCIPCEGGVEALSPAEAEKLRTAELNEEWMLIDDAHLLVREFRFKNFADAFTFAEKIAKLADEENHHPELNIGWGHVGVELTTHAIHGLSENDFILAAKIDELK